MIERTIQIDTMEYPFIQTEHSLQLQLAKSLTKVTHQSQLELLTAKTPYFIPVSIEEEEDTYTFTYSIGKEWITWEDVKDYEKNDKLRFLLNIYRFRECLYSRYSFFLHPDNIVVDSNYIPYIIHKGLTNIIPPMNISEEVFLRQFKCLIIALFNKKYSFQDLYNGLLDNAADTPFERNVSDISSLDELQSFLQDNYTKEQELSNKQMMLVPKKRFKLFKSLAISFIVSAVILAVPVIYYAFIKVPYQNNLLEANRHFIATDYDKAISVLKSEDAEGLPITAKYQLAFSYVKAETLSEQKKTNIMQNISLKSDEKYLLYWIYSGRGEFDKALDYAKSVDDPQLIMYGLLKQIEATKNNPDLSGKERDEKLKTYEQELRPYQEKYMKDEELLKKESTKEKSEGKEADKKPEEGEKQQTESTEQKPQETKENTGGE
ncbi:type VII secretion protein EssB [Priestia taiwanensis]|uniref:Type VII secretion protein EssB n=1 Tax=Priestia taiwanensis TaxID=1347902 RepID=A0A917AIB8_9BACI|nr:type VII secretion protein EssB [Priestia taiwanensis]MBM7361573.1 type VII secretion protein EssB [Priestia taiwanensis]GGE55257.1 type VII secretion protein EssB [Priestia taiwanensis]